MGAAADGCGAFFLFLLHLMIDRNGKVWYNKNNI